MRKARVYSTPSCPYCKMAKSYLKERGVQFEEINVAEDTQAAMEMIEKSGQMGVPVLEIDDHIIVGFDKKAIDQALGL